MSNLHPDFNRPAQWNASNASTYLTMKKDIEVFQIRVRHLQARWITYKSTVQASLLDQRDNNNLDKILFLRSSDYGLETRSDEAARLEEHLKMVAGHLQYGACAIQEPNLDVSIYPI